MKLIYNEKKYFSILVLYIRFILHFKQRPIRNLEKQL